jgi:hypothetical protein
MDRQSVRDMVRGAFLVVLAVACAWLAEDYAVTRRLTRLNSQAIMMILDNQEGGCRTRSVD